MVRKLIRIGNSVGVTLHKRMLRDLGMDGVTYLIVEADPRQKRIIIRKKKDKEW